MFCLHVYMYICTQYICTLVNLGGQKRVLDPSRVELKMVVRYHVDLGIESVPSARATSSLNHWTNSPAPSGFWVNTGKSASTQVPNRVLSSFHVIADKTCYASQKFSWTKTFKNKHTRKQEWHKDNNKQTTSAHSRYTDKRGKMAAKEQRLEHSRHVSVSQPSPCCSLSTITAPSNAFVSPPTST